MSFTYHFKPLVIAVVALSLVGCFGSGKQSRRSRSSSPGGAASERLSGFDLLQQGKSTDGIPLVTETVPSMKLESKTFIPLESEYKAFFDCMVKSMPLRHEMTSPFDVQISWQQSAFPQCCRQVFGDAALTREDQFKHIRHFRDLVGSTYGSIHFLGQALVDYYDHHYLGKTDQYDGLNPFFLSYKVPAKMIVDRLDALYKNPDLLLAEPGEFIPTKAAMLQFLNGKKSLSLQDLMDWSRKVTSISFGYYLAYFASDVLIPVYSNTLFCHPGADHDAFLKGIHNEEALGWIKTFERSYCGHSWDDFIVNVSHEVLNAGYCRMGS